MPAKRTDSPYGYAPAFSATMREQMRAYDAMRYPDGTRIERGDTVEIAGRGQCEVYGWDLGKGMVLATDSEGRLVRATVDMVSAPV